jgi:hypothetical protein
MKDSKSPRFVLITKARAPPARNRLIKNECIRKFMMKMAIESSMIGVEQ